MPLLSLFRTLRKWLPSLALIALAATFGCSHPASVQNGNEAVQPDEPKPPFHQNGTTATQNPDLGINNSDQPPSLKPFPFNTSQPTILPAGTLLTVRLDQSLTAKSDESQTFSAMVDVPVVVDGNTLIANGSTVKGRVEAARTSSVERNSGYVRLTLDSIRIGDHDIRLQTSSLFARGGVHTVENAAAIDKPSRIIDLSKGRKLTFRLSEPVLLPLQPAVPVSERVP